MKIKEITKIIEDFAPLSYQESYDNSGLIVGNIENVVTGILICIDSIEDVVEEAIKKKCNLIISHHPIVFSGLKKITGKTYIERTILKAIKNDIAIYASHTNIDNVKHGVNFKIAEKLKLKNVQILSPKNKLLNKLVVYCPKSHAEIVRNELFKSGAGSIGNYSECSFNSNGQGTFKANKDSLPFVGKKNIRHNEDEVKIEVIIESFRINQAISYMKLIHPYEEVAYDVMELLNTHQVGSGIVGEFDKPIDSKEFLKSIKNTFSAKGIRYTKIVNKKVKKVALCGGAGGFLLNDAINSGADVFVTSDVKYHQFFDAEDKIIIVDIGHYESEQFTKEIFYELLTKKISNFAVHLSEINTNPINYL